jgi:hypothetical protein
MSQFGQGNPEMSSTIHSEKWHSGLTDVLGESNPTKVERLEVRLVMKTTGWLTLPDGRQMVRDSLHSHN